MSINITNLKEFNRDIKRILKTSKNNQVKILKKVSFDGLRNLQNGTPRKTGRARAGWNTTVDKNPSEWKPPEGKKSYEPTEFRDLNKIKSNSKINFSNNVEYIVPLDDGHSKQAPAGIVDPVISRMHAQLSRLLKKESRRVDE